MGDEEQIEVPLGHRHIIERPRLTRLLDETSARVIMLVAPAGYGKTTLARQWSASRPHAWYQATAASGDVAALALGIAEASSTLLPGIGRRLREWLLTSREPAREVETITDLLHQELSGWKPGAWFVVDDYQMLASEASEELIHKLFVDHGLCLLLTSRFRPKWATARDLLYGNTFELGRSPLSMTTGEANLVLGDDHAQTVPGLVALANGWPAVIGLAALTPSAVPEEEDVPDALYDYFAEELLESIPRTVRDSLYRLALHPVLTGGTRADLAPPEREAVKVAHQTGMLVPYGSNGVQFHPLLRPFLIGKLRELPPRDLIGPVTSTISLLSEEGAWDDAFALIKDFGRSDLLDSLLERALPSLLREGRLATLQGWIDYAGLKSLRSPTLEFASAELEFRKASYAQSELLSSSAASAMNSDHVFRSAAYYRAGQCNYWMDQPVKALKQLQVAREAARNDSDARNALWGQFAVAVEQEKPEASSLLQELTDLKPHDRDGLVRLSSAELLLAVRDGGLTKALSAARAIAEMVDDAGDPTVRSAFWHVYGVALSLTANYRDALVAADRCIDEVQDFRIDFALPHALIGRASICIGLRRFGEASEALLRATRLAAERKDRYVMINARTVKCRLLLQEGSGDLALEATAGALPPGMSQSMRAEFLLARAAALAKTGSPEFALKLAKEAKARTQSLEPTLLSHWVSAHCALLMDRDDFSRQVRLAYRQTVVTGAVRRFRLRLSAQLGRSRNSGGQQIEPSDVGRYLHQSQRPLDGTHSWDISRSVS